MSRRPPRRLLLAVSASTFALLAAGCGTGGMADAETANVARGKELFQQNCGSCHALADAGSTQTTGPDLAAA